MQDTVASEVNVSTPSERVLGEIRSRRPFWVQAKRIVLKTVLFFACALLLLNPNLRRAFMQVRHTLQPEALVQGDFPALASINSQVDRLVAADGGRHSEARLVAKFVVKKVRYVSDYQNWGNLEYWPRAEEVWDRRQEDCDGRAILATSILRSRGYKSARLIVGLDHMWIKVNVNEKEPGKPARHVALLSPNPNFSLDLEEQSRTRTFLSLARALLHPKAFCATSTHLFAEIPTLRKAMLIAILLLLFYHPCRDLTGLLGVLAVGLGGVVLLAPWQPGEGPVLQAIFGGVLLFVALTGALFRERLLRKQDAGAVP